MDSSRPKEAARTFSFNLGSREGGLQPTPEGIRIVTPSREVIADQIFVATGPWIGEFIPGLKQHLAVTRHAVGWFTPAKPDMVRYGAFPIFIIEGSRGITYGFPDFEGRGIKAAQHDLGPVVEPDVWNSLPTNAELEVVAANLRELIPGAAGPIAERVRTSSPKPAAWA